MTESLPAQGIVLHIWPGRWDLLSFEPHSLAAVLYLQLAIPGKFRVVETPNPDTSPSGQLPYLVHEQHFVSSLSSIIKYVSDLRNADHSKYPNANLDVDLTQMQKSQRAAWVSHAESHLGDLVAHTLYAVHENWTELTGPALASLYPVPQKYYVPRRIRASYYSKLDAAGLWNALVEEVPEDKPFQKEKIAAPKPNLKENPAVAQAFVKEKVLEKARTVLDLYQEVLSNKTFVFSEHQPTSLDVIMASHILLLLKPPYPDPVVKDLLLKSYPALASHARRVEDLAFSVNRPVVHSTTSPYSLKALLPSWPPTNTKPKRAANPEDIHFNRMRWGFFGLVAGAFAVYLSVVYKDVEIKVIKARREEGNREDNIESADENHN